MNSPILKITKLDAAHRQLQTAMALWFANGDPVSIYLLSFTAYEIIHKLFRNKGHSGLLWDSTAIKDDQRTTFAKLFKHDASFFKHSERDLDVTLEFNTSRCEMFLFFGTVGLDRLEGGLPKILRAYIHWFWLHRPDCFNTDEPFKSFFPVDRVDEIRRLDRPEFLKFFFAHSSS